MTYVYRYDNWMSHMHLAGAKLRAKHWSMKKHPDAHPHKTLIANEENLSPGQGLFRISFWKDEPTLLRWVTTQSWSELVVMQRVPANHPFLQTFTKEVDDCLPDSAWLYWKEANIGEAQRWSNDGIAKPDIEILDFDGVWRPFNQSEIMEPEELTFRKLGFDVYHYLLGSHVPAMVFAKGQFMTLDGATQFVVLIVHPLSETARVYNSPRVFEHVFHELLRNVVDVPLNKCRLFIMDDAKRTFETIHLAEVPLSERRSTKRRKIRLFGTIPWGSVEEAVWTNDFSEALCWHGSHSEIFASIVEAFAVPLQRERIQRFRQLLERQEKWCGAQQTA